MPGYARYDVSDLGRVRLWWALDNACPLEPHLLKQVSRNGYLLVTLYVDGGKPMQRRVHQLVLEAFNGPCPGGMEVSHLDETRTNNRLSNLAYVPIAVNSNMPLRRERISAALKYRCPTGSRLKNIEDELKDVDMNEIEDMELDFSEPSRVRRMVEMYRDLDEEGLE